MQEGWLCPKCNKVLAPWVKECDCKIDIPYVPLCPSSWPPWISPIPSTGDPIPNPWVTTCCNGECKCP